MYNLFNKIYIICDIPMITNESKLIFKVNVEVLNLYSGVLV